MLSLKAIEPQQRTTTERFIVKLNHRRTPAKPKPRPTPSTLTNLSSRLSSPALQYHTVLNESTTLMHLPTTSTLCLKIRRKSVNSKHSFNQHPCLIDIYHHFPDKTDILYTFRGCSEIFYLACINKRHLWLCHTREMVARTDITLRTVIEP
jgi:hypothetical protein